MHILSKFPLFLLQLPNRFASVFFRTSNHLVHPLMVGSSIIIESRKYFQDTIVGKNYNWNEFEYIIFSKQSPNRDILTPVFLVHSCDSNCSDWRTFLPDFSVSDKDWNIPINVYRSEWRSDSPKESRKLRWSSLAK